MSRNRWRVLRALRVVLACLVLWLPARAASASFAPADAVVMIAGIRGAASANAVGGGTGSPADRGRDARLARTAPSTTNAMAPFEFHRREPQSRSPQTTNRAVTSPRYLLHCALLR